MIKKVKNKKKHKNKDTRRIQVLKNQARVTRLAEPMTVLHVLQ